MHRSQHFHLLAKGKALKSETVLNSALHYKEDEEGRERQRQVKAL